MKNQKGFSAVEGLLLLILVTLIGFTGYYVYSSQKSANNLYDKTASLATPSSKKTTSDVTADWKTYSSTSAQFSVKYPSTWVTGKNQQNCDGYLMLGPSTQYTGACQTEATGEISVTSFEGGKVVNYTLTKEYYPNVKKEAVTVNGVVGTRYSGTLQTTKDIFVGPGNGTKSVAYVFETNGRAYVVTYNQTPEAPDVVSDFDTMVKTLQFHS